MIAVVLLSGTSNANFYFAVVFVPNYLNKNYQSTHSFSGLFFVTAMFCSIPLIGMILDKFNRMKIMLASCIMISAANIFLLPSLINIVNQEVVLIVTILFAILLSFVFVVINIGVLEVFPAEFRFSCGATSYSVGAALLGGTAPMISSLIIKNFDNNIHYLGSYMSALSLLGVFGACILIYSKAKWSCDLF